MKKRFKDLVNGFEVTDYNQRDAWHRILRTCKQSGLPQPTQDQVIEIE